MPSLAPGARGRSPRPGASAARSSSRRAASRCAARARRRRARWSPRDEPLTRRLLDGAVARLPARASTPPTAASGGAPKFPPASALEFLLARGEREIAIATLRAMARRRHLRPGRRRLRPLLRRRDLARAALREDALRQRAARPRVPPRLAGHAATSACARSAAETLDWALREMRAPRAASTRALDADSEGVEGQLLRLADRRAAAACSATTPRRRSRTSGQRRGQLRDPHDPSRASTCCRRAARARARARARSAARCWRRARGASGRGSTTSA